MGTAKTDQIGQRLRLIVSLCQTQSPLGFSYHAAEIIKHQWLMLSLMSYE